MAEPVDERDAPAPQNSEIQRMGKRSYTVSDKAIEARRANAKKPRGPRLTENLREVMAAKLVPLLMGPGAERIGRMLTSRTSTHDEFRWASEFVANRLGLPMVAQQQLDVKGSSREVVVVAGGLGWPGVAGATEAPAAGDGDHDDRHEQPTVQ